MHMKVRCGNRSIKGHGRMVEKLEARELLAAHVVGLPGSFPTIQLAIVAAAPGGTVTVDAGTYHESVVVDKPLTLQGASRQRTVVDGAATTVGRVTTRRTSFTITANDVKLDGFTIQNNTDPKNGAGVVIAPKVAGTKIFNNNINHNVTGLYLASSSSKDPAIIRNNTFAYNNNPGQNNGRGIYTDDVISGGLLTGVGIDHNTFIGNVGDGRSGNPEAAIGLEAAQSGEQFNIGITNNVMINNGKGILMFNASLVNIASNIITGCTDTLSAAIRDEGNVTTLAIVGNSLLFNKGAGIMIDQKFGLAPSSNITINNNNFFGNAKGALVIATGGVTDTVNAENNWWGSFFGPSSSGQDALIANGNPVDSTPFSRFPIF